MENNEVVNTTKEAVNTDQETVTESVIVESVTDTENTVKSDTHQRVLSESRKFKERAQDAEKRLQELETKKLEEQGKYQELSASYKGQLEQATKINMRLAIRQAVSGPAGKSGCVNLEDLLKLGDAQFLTFDQESGTVSGAEQFVENAKQNRPWLFQQPLKPVVNSAVPGGIPNLNVETKEIPLEEALFQSYKK